MVLDYSSIFSAFVSLLETAIPVAVFLYLADIMISFFFQTAFPKRFKKGE